MLEMAGGVILGHLGIPGGYSFLGFSIEWCAGIIAQGAAIVAVTQVLARTEWFDSPAGSGSSFYYLPGVMSSCGDASTGGGGDA